jgi:hypothetical protein
VTCLDSLHDLILANDSPLGRFEGVAGRHCLPRSGVLAGFIGSDRKRWLIQTVFGAVRPRAEECVQRDHYEP